MNRRLFLRSSLAAGVAGAGLLGALGVRAVARGDGSVSPPAPPGTWRAVYQVDDFWGMNATTDQWNAPVTSGWTWVHYDLWQAPRRERGILGVSVFMDGAAAVTCVPGGRIWQDLDVPAEGRYRAFVRVVDYRRDGVNRLRIGIGGDSRVVAWGPGPFLRYPAALLARLRRAHQLLEWLDLGVFDLRRGRHRVTIEAEAVGQDYCFVDALYLCADPAEPVPARWNPLAVPPGEPQEPVKRRRTMRSDEEIATARENIRRHDWARQAAAKIYQKAEPFLRHADVEVWDLMPSTRVDRQRGRTDVLPRPCPVHGRAIFSFPKPWGLDPFRRPYRVQCAAGGEWYALAGAPSPRPLDGARFIEDSALLGHYVDQVFNEWVRPGIYFLAAAYDLSGDRRYAHKLAVLLLKVAREYPDGSDRAARTYRSPYSIGSGMVTDHVWSAADLSVFAAGYDAIFATIGDDGELVRFVADRIPELRTGADLRWYIEERLLRVMGLAVLDQAITANFAAHDRGLMAVALCLDDFESRRYPNSLDMIEWLYHGQPWKGSEHGPRRFLANYLLPDGCSTTSADYNSMALELVDAGAWMERARALHPDALPLQRYPELLGHERVRRHVDFLTGLVCLGRYHPAVGDGHGKALWEGDNVRPRHLPARLTTLADPAAVYKLFRHRPDPALARLLWMDDGERRSLYRDLFDRPREERLGVSASTGAADPERSTVFDDYGLALLRSGTGDDARVLSVSYDGPQGGHRHFDRLTLGLFAKGLDLLPELPYPRSFARHYADNFERHPLLHNTVTFDRAVTRFGEGRLTHLHEAPGLQMIAAASAGVPPTADHALTRRCFVVGVGGGNAYVLDVLDAEGGNDQHWSLHGPEARRVTVDGVAVTARPGTLAGADRRYGEPMVQADGRQVLSPLCFFTDVEAGRPDGAYLVDYDLGDGRDVHLRIRGLAEPGDELVLANARPPGDPDSYRLRYLFVRRSAAPGLANRFVHVLEPYAARPFIDRIETLRWASEPHGSPRPSGVRVWIGDRADCFIVNLSGGRVRTHDGTELDGQYCFYSETGGSLRSVFLSSATYFRHRAGMALSFGQPVVRSQIGAVDRASNRIFLPGYPAPSPAMGTRIRVFNRWRSKSYRIDAVQRQRDGVWLTLDRSALLAEGVAVGFEDATILNNVPMPHVGSGCYAEPKIGEPGWRLERVGHVGHAGVDLVVRADDHGPAPTRAALAAAFADGAVHVYGYGPGDVVELTRWSYVALGADGWRVLAGDEVQRV